MRIIIFIVFAALIISAKTNAQSNKGISFQAIARKPNGLILPNKNIAIRLSIKNDSSASIIEYQEIKSVTTNVLGLFTILLGVEEAGKIISMGSFENIAWTSPEKYLQIEIDPEGGLVFENLGVQKINYVPFSFYADNVNAKNIAGVVSVKQGGTGVTTIKEIATLLSIDKINNTPDSIKPISNLTNVALNERLKKTDTLSISNRINLKLNTSDTVKLSKRIDLKLNARDTTDLGDRIDLKLNKKDTSSLSSRINLKLNKADTVSLSNRINTKINSGEITHTEIITGLGFTPAKIAFGSFYDSAKQQALVSVATPIRFSYAHLSSDITITNNTSLLPTRITVKYAGTYFIKYMLQLLKAELASDEVSVWIRRNGSAYANTNINYTVAGNNVKNILAAGYFVELGDDDYIEIYFSVKNTNAVLTGSLAQASPSRPATPAVAVTIHSVN
ncbi:MAG: hypothetical protein RLZ16_513 [Bacteroidota bacterium]